MSEVDIARIVPSTRDLHLAVSSRRKSLSLICRIGPGAHDAEARRLDALDVRALAADVAGPEMRDAATATSSLPLLSLQPALRDEDAQRARFFGADGVCVKLADLADEEAARLMKTVTSMRMMPLLLITDGAQLSRALSLKARALLWQLQDVSAIEQHPVERGTLLIAWPEQPSAADLRALLGKADAAVAPAAVHGAADFEALLDELDS